MVPPGFFNLDLTKTSYTGVQRIRPCVIIGGYFSMYGFYLSIFEEKGDG